MSDVLIPAEVSYPGLDRLLDGRYQVNQILAIGDWGRTYLAQDTRRPSQPDCIIQHIIPLVSETAYQYALRHLFVREAATLERLGDHEQMPRLLACFEDEQGFHVVQEFVSGDSLSLELSPQPWHEEQVMQLLLECLELLAVMHRECCRHGDVRPDNLIRRSHDGKLTLTNFGTVRDVHLSLMTLQGRSARSMVPNTQGYQSPEQMQGLPCLASDVYAIGIIGIQALTGLQPLQMSRDPHTREILWQPFEQMVGSTLRHGLVAVLSRMVRADQTQRFPSAMEALQALRSLAQGVPLQRFEPCSATASSLTPMQHPLTERWLSPTMQISVGIGAVMAAAVCGYALPQLLHDLSTSDRGNQALAAATQQYQSGQRQKAVAIAASIPPNSPAYASAQAAIAQWQRKPLAQSTNPAETTAAQLLRDAYGRAIVKDFAGAIGLLKQIPEGTSVHTKAQEKLREYSGKQEIQAISYLQIAYDRAETKAFAKALESLQEISSETPIYTTAQTKIREYTAKQRLQTDGATPDLNPGSQLQEANVAGR